MPTKRISVEAVVTRIIDDIIVREGGYVDDAADAGGATKHGVSLRYAKGIGLDLDGDGDTDKDDIRLVDKDVAFNLYLDDFFVAPGINRLPTVLHAQLVDCAVLHGAPRAIMFLQKVIQAHVDPEVDDDGRTGPKTRVASEALCSRLGAKRANQFIAEERKKFMRDIVRRRPSQARFIKGWLRRADEFA